MALLPIWIPLILLSTHSKLILGSVHGDEFSIEFPSPSKSIFSSPLLLRALAEKEELVYSFLKDLFRQNSSEYSQELFSEAKPYLKSFGESTGRLLYGSYGVSSRAVAVAWNPIASFKMIQRILRLLKPFVADLNQNDVVEQGVQLRVLHILNDSWPVESDLNECCSAILRIQDTHDLPTFDIANGIWNEEFTGIKLSASDCNELGTAAVLDDLYYLGVEWLEEGLRRHRYCHLTGDCNLRALLENNMDLYIAAHDTVLSRSETWDTKFFVTKQSEAYGRSQVRRRTYEFNKWKGSVGANFNSINYWGLCSGENYQSALDRSRLFCWYETAIHPAWIINPLKAELLSAHPLLVVQYYDLIGDRTIEEIKDRAGSKLNRSGVFLGISKSAVLPVRTSVNTFVYDTEGDTFLRVSRVVEFATGLTVLPYDAAEALQVASYTPGGHYLVHNDPLNVERPGGDRIATFLFYLSDVLKGGGTAFPMAGVAAQPIKGSAVFWYNLFRSGVMDTNASHGACPVIVGEKWIGNKWIKVDAQMFSREHNCVAAQQHAVATIKINGKSLDF